MIWNTAVRAKRSGGEGGKEHAAEADDLPPHKAQARGPRHPPLAASGTWSSGRRFRRYKL